MAIRPRLSLLDPQSPSDKQNGLSPEEIFSGTRMNCSHLRRARVWGCPAYVLHPKLQDGRKIPKWEPRSRLGQFVGVSAMHSSSVKLIRNTATNYISPQFHVVFDEKFTTNESEQILHPDETWANLFTTAREHIFDDYNEEDVNRLPDLHHDYLPLSDQIPTAPQLDLPSTGNIPPNRWTQAQVPHQGEPIHPDVPLDEDTLGQVNNPIKIDSDDDTYAPEEYFPPG